MADGIDDTGRYAVSDTDSQGCLLVVASYADMAADVEPAALQAARRVLMSPELGDLVEIRFVSAGSRPSHGGMHSGAADCIADALTEHDGDFAENYFGLAIADRSATAAAEILAACDRDPLIARLPLRSIGFADTDDRDAGPTSREADAEQDRAHIQSLGAWTGPEIIEALRGYAECLLRDFASAGGRGLSRDDLASIRQRSLAPPDADESSADPGPLTLPRLAPEDAPADPDPASPVADARPDTEQAGPPATAALAGALAEPDASPPSASAPAGSPRSRWPRLLLPQARQVQRPDGPTRRMSPRIVSRRGRSRRDPQAATAPASQPGGRASAALLYLILTGDDSPDARANWRRGRSLLVEIDRKIASEAPALFAVRAFGGAGNSATSRCREAGRLSRGDVSRWTSDSDFAQSLTDIRDRLGGDLNTLARTTAGTMARPAVVLIALDAPLADAVTMQAYRDLQHDALVIWVALARSAQLLSPAFAAEDARVITDHQGAADEVVSLLGVLAAAPLLEGGVA
jgi:hypothetical protein